MARLTEKQKLFADEYIKCGNATVAYKTAYPNIKNDQTAAACAVRLLRNAKVANYIQERNQEIANSRIAGIQEVKEFWTGIMRNEDEKGTDRLKASELLAKTCGAFLEKQETDNAKVVIIDNIQKEATHD